MWVHCDVIPHTPCFDASLTRECHNGSREKTRCGLLHLPVGLLNLDHTPLRQDARTLIHMLLLATVGNSG
jgi:hypothetical protein